MLETLLQILLYAFQIVVPIACGAFFGVSLYRYISAEKKNRAVPNTYTEKQITVRMVLLIVSSVIFTIASLSWLVYILIFGLPIAAEAFLVVSIIRFILAKVKNKRVPDTYTDKQIKTRLILLIASAAIFITLIAVIIGFDILLFSAIAYM